MKSFNPLKLLRKHKQKKLLECKEKECREIKEKRDFYHRALCSCLSNGNPKDKADEIRNKLARRNKMLKVAEKERDKCLEEYNKL